MPIKTQILPIKMNLSKCCEKKKCGSVVNLR